MADNAKKPILRFAGFSDAWEARKLGDHAEILTGGTPNTSFLEYWEPKEIPWMSSGEVNKRRLYSTDHMISRVGIENSSARWVKEFSILIALAGQGKTRGTVAINYIPLTTNQSIASIIPHSTFHYEFIFQNLLKRYDELRMISSGDGTRGGLNKQIVSAVIILCPHIEEQIKVGAFFCHLDTQITLHQRKHDKLVNLKKAMLEKMFPQQGADAPEIRFAGFTDAWEQRPLGEIASFAKGSGYAKNDLRAQGSPIILYGRLYTQYQTVIDIVDTFVVAKKGSIYSKGNEVLVPASGETAEDIARASAVVKPDILIGSDLNIIYPSGRIVSPFLALSISSGETQKRLEKKAQGKSVVHLHNSDLENIQIAFPVCEEQAKISAFFRYLDTLITLHQRELEKLRNIKKSCLEKMFV